MHINLYLFFCSFHISFHKFKTDIRLKTQSLPCSHHIFSRHMYISFIVPPVRSDRARPRPSLTNNGSTGCASLHRRRAAGNGRVSTRKKAVARPFFAFRGVFLRVSGVRTNGPRFARGPPCRQQSAYFQSIRSAASFSSFLSFSSPIAFISHSRALPVLFFALHLRCPLPPSPHTLFRFPLFLTHLYRASALFLPFLFHSPAFYNLDTEKIKETLLY